MELVFPTPRDSVRFFQNYEAGQQIDLATMEFVTCPGWSEDLQETIEQGDPDRILLQAMTCNDTRTLFGLRATLEGYSGGEHTLMVLRQHFKYFIDLESPLSDNARVVLKLYHDVGKGVSSESRDQFKHHLQILDKLREKLPVSEFEFEIIYATIKDDWLGDFFKEIIPPANDPAVIQFRGFLLDLAEANFHGDIEIEQIEQYYAMSPQPVAEKTDAAIQTALNGLRESTDQVWKNIGGDDNTLDMTYKDLSEILFRVKLDLYQTDISAYSFDSQRAVRYSKHLIPEIEQSTSEHPVAKLMTLSESCQLPDRAFILLDYLLEPNPSFNPELLPEKSQMFLVHESEPRLRFNGAYEDAYQGLEFHYKKEFAQGS